MFCEQKNSYLQLQSAVNPRIINRCVNRALDDFYTIDSFDSEPPFNRLTSEQPNIHGPDFDLTRSSVAFGKWAIPILKNQLHSESRVIVYRAVNSLIDLIHDPERAFEAIKLGVIDRVVDLMQDDEAVLRERVCILLLILAGQEEGRVAIFKNHYVMANLAQLVEDTNAEVRMKVASVLSMLSRNWMGACCLVEMGFIPILVDNVHRDEEEIALVHLEVLQEMFYGDGKDIALEIGTFPIMVDLLEHHNPKIVEGAANCLSSMCSHTIGKNIAVEIKLLEKLHHLLYENRREVHTAAALAIMFATHTTKAKKQAALVKNLPQKLLEMAHDFNYPPKQIYCIKALTNMCEHPDIRKLFIENYLPQVTDIITKGDENLKHYKETLIDVINWKPWYF